MQGAPIAGKEDQESEELSSEEVVKDPALLDILNYESADKAEDKKTRHQKDTKRKKKNTKEGKRHQATTATNSEGAAQGGKDRAGGTSVFRCVDPRSVGAAPARGPFAVAVNSTSASSERGPRSDAKTSGGRL